MLTALAGAAGIAIDNARLYEEGEIRRRWVAAVSDVRAALLDAASSDEALRLIAERVATLTDADATWLMTAPTRTTAAYVVTAQSGERARPTSSVPASSPRDSPVLEAVEGGPRRGRDAGPEHGCLRDAVETSLGARASASRCTARTPRTPS